MRIIMFVTMLVMGLLAHAHDPEWIARYDGSTGSADAARSIAVDDSGNVYVTGYTWESGGFHDYLTVKYSPSGDTLWSDRYDGIGNEIDQAYALVIDDSGNVYVTGLSENSFDCLDYATIKYNSSGDSLWVARYEGPDSLDDEAYAIAVDDSGNVYVTGFSRSSVSYWDYLTIKYDASGDTMWVARYDGPDGMTDIPYDIAVDNEGNVYVTGMSQDQDDYYDYLTIKYRPDGDTLWTARYDGPDYDDRAKALAIDDFGNVYVTGRSEDSLGWSDDCVTIKYSPSGDSLWVARYDGPESYDDRTRAITVDDSGNVYVTGLSWGTSSFDYLTIKYNSSGDTLWTSLYDGPGGESDTATAIALDDSGNVYVTGASHAYDPEWDYLTIKYSPSGDTLWTARYDGPVDGNDYPYAIVVNNQGYVYVTGSSDGSGTLNDFLTIKYSSATGIQEFPGSSTRTSVVLKVFPNPFSQKTVITLECINRVDAVTRSQHSINIYDLSGCLTRTFNLCNPSKSEESVIWDGRNNSGEKVPSGVYFLKFTVGEYTLIRKLLKVR